MLISIFFSFLRAGSRIITSLERAHRRFAVQALRSRAVDKNKSAKGARRFGRARARVGAPHRSGLLALFCRSRLSACGTTVLHLLLKLAASHARTVARVSCVLRAIDAERHGFCKMIEKGIRSSCVDAGRCKGRYFFFFCLRTVSIRVLLPRCRLPTERHGHRAPAMMNLAYTKG